MISSCKMTPWMVAICCLVTADCLNVTDQQTSESQHEQVAILKQLRKINDDGSYTFGYEAGDGSYKVETRDVLGNVKGTFGFVDANGEIKRVTYSSSNGTGFKATTVSPLQERVSVVQSIPRTNRSSSTRRPAPSIAYTTSTESLSSSSSSSSLTSSLSPTTSNTKLASVQSVPRSRIKPTIMASTTTSTTTESPSKSIFGHYIKASKYRPRLIVNGQQRSAAMSIEQDSIDDQYSQITRPTVELKTPMMRKNLQSKRPIDHTLRPITEEFEEKSHTRKTSHTGNSLRRQLQEERSIKVEESPESHSDETSDVYAGSLSTTRPLFTTSSAPKIIQRIRTVRPKMAYQQMATSNEENTSFGAYDGAKYETTRVYEDNNKVAPEERQTSEQFILRDSAMPSRISQREYLIKNNGDQPIYIRQQPDQILRDLSSTILMRSPANDDEEGTTYSTLSIDRILSQQQAIGTRQSTYSQTMDPDNVDYLTDAHSNAPIDTEESTQSLSSPLPSVYSPHSAQSLPHHSPHRTYVRSKHISRLVSYPQQEYERPLRQNNLRPLQPINTRDSPDYSYRSIILPPEAPNPIAPPLSRRDFQILLRRLLVSQYGARALTHPRTYLNDALYDQHSYPTYQSTYHVSPPRQALVYREPPLPITYGDRVNRLNNAGLSRMTNSNSASYQNMQYQEPNYYDPIYTKRVYRQKLYDPEMNDGADGNGDEILPPPIREALLLRMLQLAINNERSVAMSAPPLMNNNIGAITASTPVTTSVYRKSGPVRNVQIITDDKSDEKDSITMRKKI